MAASAPVSSPPPACAAASRVAREPELRTGVRSALGMPHAVPLTPPLLACRHHDLHRARAGAQQANEQMASLRRAFPAPLALHAARASLGAALRTIAHLIALRAPM